MSELRQFIQDLRSRGVELTVEASKLKVKINAKHASGEKPASAQLLEVLTKEEVERLKVEKAKIIPYLTQPFMEQVPEPSQSHLEKDDGLAKISLSHSQQSLWTLNKYMANSAAFNMLFACKLPADVNLRALQTVCKLLVERHSQLRTSFKEDAGQVYQSVQGQTTLAFKKYTLTAEQADSLASQNGGENGDNSNYDHAVQILFEKLADETFDFSKPAIKFIWIEVAGESEQKYFGTLVHHLVADFFSYQIILAEISALYKAVVCRENIQLPSGGHNYSQWVTLENDYLASEQYHADLKYWQQRLQAPLPVLSITTDYQRPKVFSFNGAFSQFEIDAEIAEKIKQYAKAKAVTPSNLLLAIYGLFLADEAKQSEVMIGTPTGGRLEQGFEWVVGDFSNTIVLRMQLSQATAIESMIFGLKQQLLEGMSHQKLPFSHLVEKLQPVRSTQHAPLFQAMFLWHQPNEKLLQQLLGEQQSVLQEVLPVSGPRGVSYDLMLSVVDARDGMQCNWGYSSDLFDEERVDCFHARFIQLVEAVISDDHHYCSELVELEGDSYFSSVSQSQELALRAELLAWSGIQDLSVIKGSQDQWLIAVCLERDEFFIPVADKLQDLMNEKGYELSAILPVAKIALDWSRARWLSWFNQQPQITPQITPQWRKDSAQILSARFLTLQGDGADAEFNDNKALFEVNHIVQWPLVDKVHLNVDLGLPWRFVQSEIKVSERLGDAKSSANKVESDLAQVCMAPLPQQSQRQSLLDVLETFVQHEGSAVFHFYEAKEMSVRGGSLFAAWERAGKADIDSSISVGDYGNGVVLTVCKQMFWQRACQLAASLADQGVEAGDYLLVSTQSAIDQLSAFWAAILLGAKYVPLLKSSGKSEQAFEQKLQSVVSMLGVQWILSNDAELVCSDVDLAGVSCLSFPQDIPTPDSVDVSVYRRNNAADEVAVIALTSGSTGVPKAVPLTQGQIYHQLVGYNHLLETDTNDLFLNWMPLDHAAALIMMHLQALYSGASQLQVPTLDVLSEPKLLLNLISEFKVTTTWSPNFAFNLLTQLTDVSCDAEKQALNVSGKRVDLTSIRRWINGGEAISLSAMENFLDAFEDYGLKPHAIAPSWGMSETCSGVVIDTHFDFNSHRSLGAIHVGKPIPGFDLRIVNETGQIVCSGEVGKLQVRGDCVIPAYLKPLNVDGEWNNNDVFSDAWFDVGDYASLVEGQLIIRGRNSDAIIVNGLNYYSSEVEAEVMQTGVVQPGLVAAVAMRFEGDDTDRLAIAYCPLLDDVNNAQGFYEDVHSNTALLAKNHVVIAERVRSGIGLEAEFIIALAARQFPRTSLGKVQHKVIKRRLYDGEFDQALALSDHLGRRTRSVDPGYYLPQNTKLECLHLSPKIQASPIWVVGTTVDHQSRFEEHYAAYKFRSDDRVANLQANPACLESDLRFFSNQDELHNALRSTASNLNAITLVLIHENETTRPFELNIQQQLLATLIDRCDGIDVVGCFIGDLNSTDATASKLFWQTAALEHTAIHYGSITFSNKESWQSALVPLLFSETAGLEISYQHNHWMQRKLAALPIPAAEDLRHCVESFKSRQSAAVIIGCGALALGVAEVLLAELNKPVYLVGRRARDEVKEIAFTRLMNKYSDRVFYHRADATDLVQLSGALDTIVDHAADCSVDTVFQLAGIYEEQELLSLQADHFASLAQMKLVIAQNLDNYFSTRTAAEIIHFSSVNGTWTASGVYAYALQNALLEQFCRNSFQATKAIKHRALALPVWQNEAGNGVGAGGGLTNLAVSLAESKGFIPLRTQTDFPRLVQLVLFTADQAVVYVGLNAAAPMIRSQLLEPPEAMHHCVVTPVADALDVGGCSTQLQRLQAQSPTLEDHGGRAVPLLWSSDDDLRIDSALLQAQSRTVVAPSQPLEQELHAIWQAILPVSEFGVEDNFFALGGHSLSATRVVGRIREQLQIPLAVNELFQHPTIRELAQRLAKMQSGEGSDNIVPVPRQEKMPLSFAQQRLWFLYTLEGVSATYNIPAAVRMRGPLQLTALQRALQSIIERQEIMRCYFQANNEGGSICVAEKLAFKLEVETAPSEDTEAWVHQIYEYEAATGFNLTEAPLFRVRLLQLSEQEHVFIMSTHHIVSDGWSVGVFIQELVSFYSAYVRNTKAALPDLPIQYLDFVQWQQTWFESDEVNQQINYWVEKLKAAPPILDLPTDFPRPAIQRYVGAEQHFSLTGDELAGFKRFCDSQGVTLYMFLLASFNVLLFRHSQQQDISVGTPVANRSRAELEPLLGLFVNTLVMRNSVDSEQTFMQLLESVKTTALEAFNHQEAPFERVVEILQPDRSLSHSPLFQVMFILQNAPMDELTLLDLELSPIERESTVAKYDLTLQFVEYAGELKGALEFNRDLFSRDTIERMIRQLREILRFVVTHPESAISEIPLLDRRSEVEMLQAWNNTTIPLDTSAPFYQQILSQCQQRPNAIAVEVNEQSYSYADLAKEIERISSALWARGVSVGDLVAVTLERGFGLVASLVAVLRTGAAYIPIDPEYPEERVKYMLEHAQPKVVLANNAVAERLGLEGETVLLLEELSNACENSEQYLSQAVLPSEHDLAYVIYTSGSTGKPKGVKIHHGAILNLLEYFARLLAVKPGERWLAVTSLSFDIATLEIFLPLMKGATISLATFGQSMRGDWLLEQICEREIDYLQATPATWQLLIESDWKRFAPTHLTALCGGEALKKNLAGKILPQVQRLYNVYGPTETTVWSLSHEVTELNSNIVEIGKPLDNTYLVVVDQKNKPVPVGVAGELLIGGLGVGKGYLRREDLTSERFIENPIADDFMQRHAPIMYRTGDVVRYRADGTLVYLDRLDHQVKIRGFRIELGEVEAALISHQSVSSAVAMPRPQDDGSGNLLVAYVVMKSAQKFSANKLKEWVSHQLPHYMVPSIVASIDAFPLTPNGKVDRKALPDIKSLACYEDRIYVGPRDHIELKLIHLWEEVLNTGPISVTDNFFDLGGHSLLAMRLISRVQEVFNQALPMSLLFQSTNVENMANYLRQSNEENRLAQKTALVCIEAGDPSLAPLFLVHPAGGSVFCYRELANALKTNQPVYGLQLPLDAKGEPVESQIEAMATLYIDAIEDVFGDQQIILGGWSMGGVTAFEMARQLELRGRPPKLLMLIDSSEPNSYEYIEVLDELNLLVMMAMELGLQIHQLAFPRVVGVSDEEGLQYLLELCKDHGLLPQNFDIENIRDRLTLLRSNQDAQMSYRVGGYGGCITVIHAQQQVSIRTDQEYLGWKNHAGAIVTDETPGDHFSLIRKPNVGVLADILAKHMAPYLDAESDVTTQPKQERYAAEEENA